MLGIALHGSAQNSAFTWENARHTLCMQRKLELSTRHAVIGYKWPNIYRVFIGL
jgi:hypothetical protein